MHMEICNLVAIAEAQCGALHNWSSTVEGCELFRSDRWGKEDGGVVLYVKTGCIAKSYLLKKGLP